MTIRYLWRRQTYTTTYTGAIEHSNTHARTHNRTHIFKVYLINLSPFNGQVKIPLSHSIQCECSEEFPTHLRISRIIYKHSHTPIHTHGIFNETQTEIDTDICVGTLFDMSLDAFRIKPLLRESYLIFIKCLRGFRHSP